MQRRVSKKFTSNYNILRNLDFIQKKELIRDKELQFFNGESDQFFPTEAWNQLLRQLYIPPEEKGSIDKIENDEIENIRNENVGKTKTDKNNFYLGNKKNLEKIANKIVKCKSLEELKTITDQEPTRVFVLAPFYPRVLENSIVKALLIDTDCSKNWIIANLKFGSTNEMLSHLSHKEASDYQQLAMLHDNLFETATPWVHLVPYACTEAEKDLNSSSSVAATVPGNDANGSEEKNKDGAGLANLSIDESKKSLSRGSNTILQDNNDEKPENKEDKSSAPITREAKISATQLAKIETESERINKIYHLLESIDEKFLLPSFITEFPLIFSMSVRQVKKYENWKSEDKKLTRDALKSIADFSFVSEEFLKKVYKRGAESNDSYMSLVVDLLTAPPDFETISVSLTQLSDALKHILKDSVIMVEDMMVFIDYAKQEYVILSDTISKKAVTELNAKFKSVPIPINNYGDNLDLDLKKEITKVFMEKPGKQSDLSINRLAFYLADIYEQKFLLSSKVNSFCKNWEINNFSADNIAESLFDFRDYLRNGSFVGDDNVRNNIRHILEHGIKCGFFLEGNGQLKNFLVAIAKQHLDLSLDLLNSKFHGLKSLDFSLKGEQILDILEFQWQKLSGGADCHKIRELLDIIFKKRFRWFRSRISFADKLVKDNILAGRLLDLIKAYPAIGAYILADRNLAASFIDRVIQNNRLEELGDIELPDKKMNLLTAFYTQSQEKRFCLFGKYFGKFIYSSNAIERLKTLHDPNNSNCGNKKPVKENLPLPSDNKILKGDKFFAEDHPFEISKGRKKFSLKHVSKDILENTSENDAPLAGVGGFGSVFKISWDEASNKQAAVKAIVGQRADSVFEREAAIQNYLTKYSDNNNIVKLYGVCTVPYVLFMEYMEKGPLTNVITANDLSWGMRYQVSEDILKGLKYIHDSGVIHLDVKCSNVLLNEEGHAKIADFGTAEFYTGERIVNLPKKSSGTICYMAPERLRSGESSPASDMYSFGVILRQLMTGLKPYAEEEKKEDAAKTWSKEEKEKNAAIRDENIKHKILHDQPEKNIPSDIIYKHPILAGIMSSCLFYIPNKRPTAEEALQMLVKAKSASEWQTNDEMPNSSEVKDTSENSDDIETTAEQTNS